jgi:hypothetical protein
VQFTIDGKEQDISDNFKMFFSQKGNVLEAKVAGNYIKLPRLSSDKNVTVSFVCDSNKLNFKDVSVSELYTDQDMEWDFKVLNKDFISELNYLDTVHVKKLYVWGFNPQEHGEGIDWAFPIYK